VQTAFAGTALAANIVSGNQKNGPLKTQRTQETAVVIRVLCVFRGQKAFIQ
jgi:hypothetical protein